MNKLMQSALCFKNLMRYEYIIVAGSKKTLIQIPLYFRKEHFMHLIALHKLTDLQLQRYSKVKIYNLIMEETITYDTIRKSVFFSEIENRIKLFPTLEQAIDSNELMIKYKRGFTTGTLISASYIILYEKDDTIIHYFIEQDIESGKYYGKSFFGRNDDKFFKGQQTFKVLKKLKINIEDRETQMLVDKLKRDHND